MAGSPWLAVIDLQVIFARPDSPWAAPGFAGILSPVRQLMHAAGDRCTVTRFIAPAQPSGAWVSYYEQWPFALQSAEAPDYQLVPELADVQTTSDVETFGKWTPALAEQVRSGGGALLLAGVSTDCCVLSTALAAADDGVAVRVVGQACAGADEASHERALTAMAMYAPLIEVISLPAALDLLQQG